MLLRNTCKYTYGWLANTDDYIGIIHRDKQRKGEKGGEKGRRKNIKQTILRNITSSSLLSVDDSFSCLSTKSMKHFQ